MIRATFALLGDVVGFCALLLILGGGLTMLGALSLECATCGGL